jgi:RHS repeat-associated protein
VTRNDSSGITTFAWDYENRLSSVTLPGSGGTVSFKYDPFGRRIYKSSTSGTSIYAYDGDNLVEETNSSGAAVARYSQGLNIDEPLAMLRSSTTSFYQADGLGSITSLSNGAGALAQTYTFDSFGNQTASSGSLTNPFRYTAREWDAETNLYSYHARYMDSSVGRFLTEDPIGPMTLFQKIPSSPTTRPSAYLYADNNPILNVDPMGREPQLPGAGADACKYYDDVAKQFGCKYHGGSGGRYCRNPRINLYFAFRSTVVLNKVRKCLIDADKEARNDPKNQPCSKPGCVKRSVITQYHKACFEQNGLSFTLGFWKGYWPFDDDRE